MNINRKIKKISCICLMIFSSNIIYTQQEKGSATLQREARSLLRGGNELYKKGEYTDAGVSYKKALEKNSTYRKASYNLGNALYQQKNYKEAIPQYELTAEVSEDKYTKAEAFHNLGNSMMEQKQYQQAVDAFKNSLRNNPNDDETRYNLAIAKKELKKQKGGKNGKDGKNKDKDKKKGDDKNSRFDNSKRKKEKLKPMQGKMSPQQVKRLLKSLKNEENKTRKKMNFKKTKGKKVKQEKDW